MMRTFSQLLFLVCALIIGVFVSVCVVKRENANAANGENCGCHPHKAEKKFVHQPVRDGECPSCHKPSGQKHPKAKKEAFILTDNGKSGLCSECHERKDTLKFVHKPVAAGDCLDCHDVHQSENKFQLKASGSQLCFMCHDEQQFKRNYPHAPIAEGKCTNCHDPHQSNNKYMLKKTGVDLCLTCHDNRLFVGKSVHSPVASGECQLCHVTHGTTFPHLLKSKFPEDFYLTFDKSEFALCFGCHSNFIADDQRTDKETNFRNGLFNLHYVHVNKQEKGRSCKTCHDPHAAAQPRLISNKIQGFGRWRIPIKYTKTDTGGTCVAGCHKPKSYDRINQINNP